MGFVDTSEDPTVPVFFNVVHAVGANCPNHRDDVKLVQYLLKSFYAKAYTHNSVYTPPNGNMTVDGACGPITLNWILKFQLDVNKRYPGTVACDDRVDRARDHKTTGSISNTVYTILVLNKFTRMVNPEAYAVTPQLIALQNPDSVPTPGIDVVQLPTIVPDEIGGF